MAKENTVVLYGWVTERPKERTIGFAPALEINVLTVKKSGMDGSMRLTGAERWETIPVITKNAFLRAQEKSAVEKHCFIYVKGTFCTAVDGMEYICPHCGEITEYDKTISYVDPLVVWRSDFGEVASRAEAEAVLRTHMEISNLSFMYGTVGSEPEFYQDERKSELRFPLMVRRKRRITEDPEEKYSDRPWVRIFGERNAELKENISIHSGIYIRGALQNRTFDDQLIACENCGEPFRISGRAVEEVPYTIKYQKKCGSDNKDLPDRGEGAALDGGDIYAMPPDENTVILAGWVTGPPKIGKPGSDGRPSSAQFSMRVFRKRYDGDDIAHRGETRADVFRVRTKDPELIDRITHELPVKQAQGSPPRGYIVLVKGSVRYEEGRITERCANCGAEFLRTYDSLAIEPSGIWKEAGPVEADDAAFILHGIAEAGNMVFCHGVLQDEPEFTKDPRYAECRFGLETHVGNNKKTGEEKEGGEEPEGDLSFVTVTGDTAVQCADVLHSGSVVFLNGALRNVVYDGDTCLCPECGAEVDAPRLVREITPYQVEYHARCDIPAAEEEDDYE